MNFKDISNLRFKDIKSEKFSFARAKTKSTNSSQKAITVHLNDFTKAVIEKYKSTDESPENYLFEVLKHGQSPLEQYRLIKNFIRSINQNFLKYAKNNGIEEKISSYWARHSFATMAIRKGASIEFVGEAVGHTNIKTTMGYFAGFEDETKKAISDKLLDF
jgi:integrase/recombinase XerD